MMVRHLVLPAVAVLLGGCSLSALFEEEAAVQPDPVYCYQSLGRSTGSVTCYQTPVHRDQRRLVNFYGPHPETYPRPAPPAPARLSPPPSVDFYVRDPEPVPPEAPPLPAARPRADTGAVDGLALALDRPGGF